MIFSPVLFFYCPLVTAFYAEFWFLEITSAHAYSRKEGKENIENKIVEIRFLSSLPVRRGNPSSPAEFSDEDDREERDRCFRLSF
jgi:hypothetical protein